MIGRGAGRRVRQSAGFGKLLSLSSFSSAMVGSMAPHPAGDPGWSGGLARDLGEAKATEL
jgi:hypothetical protein